MVEGVRILVIKTAIATLLLLGHLALAQTETYLSANGTNPETTRGESRLLHYAPENFPVEVYIPPAAWLDAERQARTTVRRAFEAWADAAPELVSFTFLEEPKGGALVVDWQPLEGLAGSYRYSFNVEADGRYDYRATSIILDPATEQGALYRFAVLQVGHALGLFGRSPFEGDALSAVPSGEVTARDVATLRALYALPSGTVLRE